MVASGLRTSMTRSLDPALDTKSLSSSGLATPAFRAISRNVDDWKDLFVICVLIQNNVY